MRPACIPSPDVVCASTAPHVVGYGTIALVTAVGFALIACYVLAAVLMNRSMNEEEVA
jgi:phage shock protein PspC (stress-responsive transcriptional regulator)